MWRVGLFILLLTPLLSAASLGAIGAGSIVAPPPALEGLDACELPCWYRIIPRTSELEHADIILLELGYTDRTILSRNRVAVYKMPDGQRCDVGMNFGGGTIITVVLTQCPNVRLGDVLAILGQPEGIMRQGLALSFRRGNVIVAMRGGTCRAWFNLYTPVSAIYLSRPGQPPRRNPADFTPAQAQSAFAWRGFAGRPFYERAEPEFPRCQ